MGIRAALTGRRDRASSAPIGPSAAASPLSLGPSSIDPMVSAFGAMLSGLGIFYTPALIDKVGTASRCLQLVAQQIATMALRFRRSDSTPGWERYTPAWVSNPDPVWYPNGIGDALFAITWSMYARGEAFIWATSRYESGYPATWTVLDPITMDVQADPGGDGRTYRSNGVLLDPDDVRHMMRDPRGGLRGTPSLQAYAAELSEAFQSGAYAADMLAGGGVPHAVLKSARRLTAEQAAELQGQWTQRVAARLAAPAIIPPDLDFQELAWSPRDLMLLESREWNAKQIAAAFGVPPPLLNMALAGGLTYANPEQLFELWWRSELYPASRRIENALSTWLPRGNWVEFDPSTALRPDLPAMTDMWLKLLNAGVVTEDEVRAAVLDLPPLAVHGEALALIDEPPGANAAVGSEPVPALEVVAG